MRHINWRWHWYWDVIQDYTEKL